MLDGLGGRVAEARKNIGWSQAKLASAAGVSSKQISKIETGLSSPSVEVLARVSEATGQSLEWLIHGVYPEQRHTGRSFARTSLDRLLDHLADQDFAELAAIARVKMERK